ncbi:MAG: DNA-3-methyladenine glycosylase I [Clostridia bacterium]|nr:DNA-3-methyladenine glycosylase I [Clostridia bacterium]
MENKPRCSWCNLKNELYIRYHDEEWCRPNFDDRYLFEMLILESFQAGLSWECILNKRENFRAAFDGFDAARIAAYGEGKVAELLDNSGVIRNRLKIRAAIGNARAFLRIQQEFGSFRAYLVRFTGEELICEVGKLTSELSDRISADLQRRGMKFVGSTIIYSYLQAVGVLYSHEEGCFLHREWR